MDVVRGATISPSQPVGWQGERVALLGNVSTVQPAPAAFDDALYVTVTGIGDDYVLGPCNWGAVQGTRLPAQGADCLVVFDTFNIPTVVWFAATPSFAPATPPVVTGSKAGNAALASLCTALAGLGYITDSTT